MTINAPENTQETTLNQPEAGVEQKKVDNTQKVDAQASQQETKEQDKPEDPNWKAFREARKKDRIEKEEALRKAAQKEEEVNALKAAMEAAFSKGSPSPQVNQNAGYDYGNEETEDQRIEKKVQAAIAAREAASERARIEREMQEYPSKLQQTYPDFSNVVSQENLDYLDYHYPEISRPLNRLKDGFDKWSDIYHAVKKLIPNSVTAKKEAMKADINQGKPRSMSTTGLTQTQNQPSSNILTEERKTANWERMRKTMNSVG